jgi:hypothetical protein
MWGITMLLMRLADYFQGRKDKSKDKTTCRLCDYVARDERELDSHLKQIHSN